jgi:glycosyltransferase domain-containing protein
VNKLSLEQALTIVIITRDRKELLERLLRIYKNSKFCFLIMDGSTKVNKLNKFLIPKNIQIYYEPSLSKRLHLAADNIKTKYAMLASDDDIFVNDGILKSIEFLENHPDFNSCMGQSLGFYKYKHDLLFFPCRTENLNYYNKSDSIKRRLRNKLSPYSISTFYAVHRRKNFIVNLRSAAPYEETLLEGQSFPMGLNEITFEICSALHGNSIALPHLSWLVSDEIFKYRSRSSLLTFNKWLKDPKYQSGVKYWINQVSQNFKSIKYEELEKLLYFSISLYINTNIDKKYFGVHKILFTFKKFFRIERVLPFILIRLIDYLNYYIQKRNNIKQVILLFTNNSLNRHQIDKKYFDIIYSPLEIYNISKEII